MGTKREEGSLTNALLLTILKMKTFHAIDSTRLFSHCRFTLTAYETSDIQTDILL